MSGKGLESLIPRRDPQRADDDALFDDDTASYDEEEIVREEREGLGVLSDLSSGQPKDTFEPSYHEASTNPSAHERRQEEHFSSFPSSSTTPAFEEEKEVVHEMGPVFQIEIEKIVANPYQPRKTFDEQAIHELAVSIREYGILQPLVVEKQERETELGTRVSYQLIAGHRRLLGAKKAGLKTVPAIVREKGEKSHSLEMAIVENIQRQELSSIETARAYARLSDEFGMTQREIAAKLGKSRESVANTLRLLSLPSDIQDALLKGDISESSARLLLQVSDPQIQKELFLRARHDTMSVRELKRYMKSLERNDTSKEEHAPQATSVGDIRLHRLERELSETLGAPVRVEQSKKGGKIIIHFYSPEEIDGIVSRIKRDQL